MKKSRMYIAGITSLILLSACSSNVETTETATTNITAEQLASASSALETLAPRFANVILNSDDFTNLITEEALKLSDGDYDVLYETVKNTDSSSSSRKTASTTIESSLKNAFVSSSRSASAENYEETISAIPFLNIYYYSPDYTKTYAKDEMLVTYIDYTVDENEEETLTAYDKDGNVHYISGIEEPDQPVFVLGINERIDYASENETGVSSSRSAGVFDSTITHDESLTYVRYYAKYGQFDPWPRGYPEVYMLFAYADKGIKQYYPEMNKPGTYDYSSNGVNFSLINKSENENWKVVMYDEDVGSITTIPITLTYTKDGFTATTTVNFDIHNNDDLMGENIVGFYHPNNYNVALGSVATLTFNYTQR